jgi:hypothetical protein
LSSESIAMVLWRRGRWVEPIFVAEISYTGVLRDRLREPVFRGLIAP